MTDTTPPAPRDRRFASAAWQAWPFAVMSQNFLWAEHQRAQIGFAAQQMVDLASPANFIWSNPKVLARTFQTGGANLWQGTQNWLAVKLRDLQCPVFCLGTVRDQVAPWGSVYRLHRLTDFDITFVRTSGGHKLGIVNPPGVPGRSYQMLKRARGDLCLAPDAWLEAAPHHDGSWWPAWLAWLQARSGEMIMAPSVGAPAQGLLPICPAPGTYVLQR